MLEKVTSDFKVEPALQPLSGEEIKGDQSDEARSDISARRFWIEDREHSSTLGYLIPTLNVTKTKRCENIMKSRKKKKGENTVHEF